MKLADTLSRLISFKTVSGENDEIKKLYAWVRGELTSLPLYFYEHEFNGVPNLVITTQKDQKNPRVWLASHVDVIGGAEKIFDPYEKEGKLYGRGAHDMKFAAACYMQLFKELGESLSDLDIGIMLTGDEEVAGFNGTLALLQKAGYRGELVFLPDGGGVWQFEEAAKGMWTVELTAQGKFAHSSSRPWRGESAIKTLSHAITELYALAEEFWIDTPEHWHLTYNVGQINGGVAFNTIAENAVATFDVRATCEEERQRFEKRAWEILAKYPSISRREMWNELPYGISRHLPAAEIFARLAKEKYGIECGWSCSHGSSDARHFARYDIPSILIWPNAGGMHSENEWIDLADLERFYKVVKNWVKEVGVQTPAKLHKKPMPKGSKLAQQRAA